MPDIEIIEDRFLNIVCNYKFEGEKQKEEQGKARLLLRHPRDVLILKYISLCHSADVNSYFSVFKLFLSRELRPRHFIKFAKTVNFSHKFASSLFHFQTWYIDHHSNFSIASAPFTLTIAKFLPTDVSSNEAT